MLSPPEFPGSGRAGPIKAFFSMLVGGCLECVLLVTLYAVFSETIGLLSDVYLSELPVTGPLFERIDEDLSVSHLIAAMLAFVACAVPIFIWSEVLSQRIYADPQAWLSQPGHQVAAVLAAVVLLIVVALEVVNLYTLIARQSTPSVLPVGGQTELMAFLADNKALAIVVSLLLAVINIVVGFFTARAMHDLKTALKEAGL